MEEELEMNQLFKPARWPVAEVKQSWGPAKKPEVELNEPK